MDGRIKNEVKRKRIPYGMMNYEDVRLEGCYYVDKTRFIPEIEDADKFFFFIRPRRFGKSLLLSMLMNYYDVLKADRFDRLFGDLWIGRQPTDARNTYLVLYLNFAMFGADLDNYEEALDKHCRMNYKSFCEKYAALLPPGAADGITEATGAKDGLSYVADMAAQTGRQIYLFIDEYDNFTNAVLADRGVEMRYMQETHGTGAFRAFFNTLKGTTFTSVKRLFVTGVSPVTMDDLTSGFNIGTNYTTQPEFNDMVGFTEDEVRQMLEYYRQFGTYSHTTDELLALMRPWYDNYCFAPECAGQAPIPSGGTGGGLYNSDMVLYFANNYFRRGTLPRQMTDRNIRTDYNRLRLLIRKDVKMEHEGSVVQQIIETGTITAELKDSFPAEAIARHDNFVSLLYYFGMLSISGAKRGKVVFVVPNQTVREQLYGYMVEAYRERHEETDEHRRSQLYEGMAYEGLWQPFFGYIADTMQRQASVRDKGKGEAFVHGFTLAHTCLSPFYLPVSEADSGATRGYADIYLQPLLSIYPDVAHSYIVEMKFRRSDASDTDTDNARQEAIVQLQRYDDSELVGKTKGSTRLHRIILVWKGMQLALAEEI